MREILPGIFTWPWFSERHGYDFNGYLVADNGGAGSARDGRSAQRGAYGGICIDPVEMDESVLGELAQKGVSRIVLTNRNHFRAAAMVKERTGAPIAIHPSDAQFARDKGTPIDADLAHGGRIGPFTVVDAHGKSPGEIALFWPERRLLVVGDACVGKTPGECAVLPDKVLDDKPALCASLRRLAALEFDALLLGDGHSVLQGGRQALERLVARLAS
jgi:glyoxylase-like metal-dependent hydrolase (beta-lactamase superfamily II)